MCVRNPRTRRRKRTSGFLPALICGAAFLVPAAAAGQSCPQPLAGARRLVLVTSESMASTAGVARLFERASPEAKWQPAAPPEPVLLGRAGMAWGIGFQHLAADGESRKVEGDGRTPAGIYRIGRSFGFGASPRPGYQRLTADTVCVDDPASPAYNTVTSRRLVGRKARGENMRSIAHYRQGLAVDYPTDAKARGGSCIFIHVQRSPTSPTAGCLALPEARVVAWQEFSESGAVLASLPREALGRLSDCLPEAR
jgi:L,D-peptidoglycan transpeptidase YkuD (ErfK/YbiS/YcfS/YnhG family)